MISRPNSPASGGANFAANSAAARFTSLSSDPTMAWMFASDSAVFALGTGGTVAGVVDPGCQKKFQAQAAVSDRGYSASCKEVPESFAVVLAEFFLQDRGAREFCGVIALERESNG